MEYRTEHDSMGQVQVPADALWGAQTQRSYQNFRIGSETMPENIIRAFALLKKAAAQANDELDVLPHNQAVLIQRVCDEILAGQHRDQFPLKIWQTGSGTQTNMNFNEVIANRGNQIAAQEGDDSRPLHPNDSVNRSQSSNDTFPTALHIAAALGITEQLIPAGQHLIGTFHDLEVKNQGIIKCGRTHLQDAVPIAFSQEIHGWRGLVQTPLDQFVYVLPFLYRIALGGTAVGTGLNAPKGFDTLVADKLHQLTGLPFRTDPNKFHALTSKDAIVFAHASVKALACNMMKVANDVRWLASGPRLGLGETVQVMGNDAAIGFAASQGNFELNVFMPVIAYDFCQSATLLSDAMESFNIHCAQGIVANREKMSHNLHNSLMLVTCLNPYIGYENAAKVAQKAYKEGTSLRDACVALGFLTAEEFDKVFKPEEMV